MKIPVLGIDLAKHMFQSHGVDAQGERSDTRETDTPQALSLCDAACTLPYWHGSLPRCAPLGAEDAETGADVQLIRPQFVTPYCKSHKNDPFMFQMWTLVLPPFMTWSV
jgi:transposase